LTRTAPPDAIAEAPQPISEAPNVQVVSKEQQHQGISRQEADKRQQDYMRWMIDGGTAANAQQWAVAVTAYQEALKAAPGDAAAGRKLEEAKSALDNQVRAALGDKNLQNDLKKLLTQGEEALANNQFPAALEIYKLVLQQSPGDD